MELVVGLVVRVVATVASKFRTLACRYALRRGRGGVHDALVPHQSLPLLYDDQYRRYHSRVSEKWQGRQDLNLQPTVLETVALPIELRPSAAPGRADNRYIVPHERPSPQEAETLPPAPLHCLAAIEKGGKTLSVPSHATTFHAPRIAPLLLCCQAKEKGSGVRLPLPRLAMNGHFPLRPAILFQFHPLRIIPLVLLGRVVAVAALRTFECDDRAVRFSFCHGTLLSGEVRSAE